MTYPGTAIQIYDIPSSASPDAPDSALDTRPGRQWAMLIAWPLALLVLASIVAYVLFGILSQLPSFSPPGTNP